MEDVQHHLYLTNHYSRESGPSCVSLRNVLSSILCFGKADHSELILVTRKSEHHGIM